MTHFRDVIWCDGCGAEITWAPVLAPDQREYCCPDCRDGRPCDCGDRMDPEDECRSGNLSDGPTVAAGAYST
ncbi:MAG: hypothetical protein RMK99_13485 [Anaerolineales bacterium]|nr:hypothetical protein [Anaerolineales bacterium]